jgi:hypothetical protein
VRAFSHDTPKFSARIRMSQIEAKPFMRSPPPAKWTGKSGWPPSLRQAPLAAEPLPLATPAL